MAKTFIKASEVRKGDRIKVVLVTKDRTTSYVGVADHSESYDRTIRWRTPDNFALWTDLDGVTIQLLERPVPKHKLPTGEGAVIEYQRIINGKPLRRVASYDSYDQSWRILGANSLTTDLRPTRKCDELGAQLGDPVSPAYLRARVNDAALTTGFKVLFAGAAL